MRYFEFKHSILRVAASQDGVPLVRAALTVALLALTRKFIFRVANQLSTGKIAALATALPALYWSMRGRDDGLDAANEATNGGTDTAR